MDWNTSQAVAASAWALLQGTNLQCLLMVVHVLVLMLQTRLRGGIRGMWAWVSRMWHGSRWVHVLQMSVLDFHCISSVCYRVQSKEELRASAQSLENSCEQVLAAHAQPTHPGLLCMCKCRLKVFNLHGAVGSQGSLRALQGFEVLPACRQSQASRLSTRICADEDQTFPNIG